MNIISVECTSHTSSLNFRLEKLAESLPPPPPPPPPLPPPHHPHTYSPKQDEWCVEKGNRGAGLERLSLGQMVRRQGSSHPTVQPAETHTHSGTHMHTHTFSEQLSAIIFHSIKRHCGTTFILLNVCSMYALLYHLPSCLFWICPVFLKHFCLPL